MNKIKRILLKIPFTCGIIEAVSVFKKAKLSKNKAIRNMYGIQQSDKKIFYLGAPTHANLGDLAQGVCIRRWIKKHYPHSKYIEIETNAIVCFARSALSQIKKIYNEGDVFVFQSGYTTTDLGGHADEMHRRIIKAFPDARFLMMPQTIYFKSKKRKRLTSKVYNSAKNMIFLARDKVYYKEAKEMFPDITVAVYPDIVTTLIGKMQFDHQRDGILFCCRDDGEKFYSDAEIDELMKRCATFAAVSKTDTTKSKGKKEILDNPEKFILSEIEQYSHYRLIVTDRYHGTIFSLISGTPVIVIKTTDHKVTTGAEWFKGIYDDYVYRADSLEQAFDMTKLVYPKDLTHALTPYFEKEYYDKLPEKLIRIV